MRLRLGSVATRLDAILSDAARKEPSYLAFLDSLLGEELDAKQKKRVAMGIQIAHFPIAKTLVVFDFKVQPSIDAKLVREFDAKPKLLIIDELGYLPLERASAQVSFQLVTRRDERGSILLTTNQPITEWGHVFGEDMIAAAVLDRMLHHSHTLVVTGERYRLKQQKRAGLLTPSRKG